MPRLASMLDGMRHSGIKVMVDLVQETPDAIRLEVGDPDLPTPSHIIEAAGEAARAGWTKYTPSAGLRPLRELAARKVVEQNGLSVDADQIVVTTGAVGGLFTTLLAILDRGDEVLVPDPGWAGYPAIVQSLGAVPTPYPLESKDLFEPDLEALRNAISEKTKVIIVNSPGNPTGAVHSVDTLQAIVDLAAEHDLWVVSDECYEKIVFDGEHVSPATLETDGRVVSIYSLSKTYSMTGWRVGYVVAPRTLAPFIAKLQEPVTACASAISQKAAEAALGGPQSAVEEMRVQYLRRRDMAMELLDASGTAYVRPRGAFYLMVDVSPSRDSTQFAIDLLKNHGVAVVPGIAFGTRGEGLVRVSLAASESDIREGLRRLGDAV